MGRKSTSLTFEVSSMNYDGGSGGGPRLQEGGGSR